MHACVYMCMHKQHNILNLNGIRSKEPVLGIIYEGGVCAHVIECLSRRSGS